VVVKDGPGFLVNRILTPYMLASSYLIADGADFVAIDQTMEAFGWPMGPNYLNDVIGMDTAKHVSQIICAGFPGHMQATWQDSVSLMVSQGRLGQKNGVGFYRYESDPVGKPKKSVAPESYQILAAAQSSGAQRFSEQGIIERMMLPIVIEAARALEDGQVQTPAELDMALLLGLGFPQYLGGALKYADWIGLETIVSISDRYARLGPLYHVTPKMREMAAQRQRYYPQ